ncbi:hypothetical protein ONV78_30505 [Hahella sp. CR1]|uniref:hypothetical protein n=1 Tax=Hahella sp. CR1 TaxID=2992807 RepID=UPI0024412F54|nr:hypothetical protein [Hahella sp. CR1]MDG9672104.1 hypothetical protein [Hahella sp. CR1]
MGGSRSATISGNNTRTSANKTVNVQGNHADRKIQAQIIELKASSAVTIQTPAIAMGGGCVAGD